jgi:hypothetical protein
MRMTGNTRMIAPTRDSFRQKRLVTPELELHDLGRTEHLTLVRLISRPCIRLNAMFKAAGAGTSINVSLEYSRSAFLHKGLLDPVEGTSIQLPVYHRYPHAGDSGEQGAAGAAAHVTSFRQAGI